MVKCAAANCRSGRKPTKSELQILQQEGRVCTKKSVFAFRKKDTQEIREQWIKVLKLKHKNWNPDNFGVCEIHFQETNFFDHNVTWRNKARQRKALRPSAIPSVIKCYPKSCRPKQNVPRPTKMVTQAARIQAEK